MQIDAHMTFAQDWDLKLLEEWAATENEFAVISTVPLNIKEQETTSEFEVPRNCAIEMLDTGIPHYTQFGDGKVKDLKKPLLAHSWNPGFSFAKCHLEESAPYDGLAPFILGVEPFGRYARMWTRGYDVYTPTRNIVFHNYQANPLGHNTMEWMKPRFARFRDHGIRRVRTFLGFRDGLENFKVDNLGIYGVGKRRSLEQLGQFIGIDMTGPRKRPAEVSLASREGGVKVFDAFVTANILFQFRPVVCSKTCVPSLSRHLNSYHVETSLGCRMT